MLLPFLYFIYFICISHVITSLSFNVFRVVHPTMYVHLDTHILGFLSLCQQFIVELRIVDFSEQDSRIHQSVCVPVGAVP